MRHPLLYEINTRCWLTELSERAGRGLTLADIPDAEFDFWQRRGFTHLWLMGVWTLGARGRAWSEEFFRGREDEFPGAQAAGSPYAIIGYDVAPDLGAGQALAQFRHQLNERGIKLVLDFIPNHTALDHPWVSTHPQFYVTSDARRPGMLKPFPNAGNWFAHGHDGHGTPWVDTLQLDYRNPELRQAMIGELLKVARICDGVRCDMAMLQLNDVFFRIWREFPSPHAPPETEFWKEAIGSLRQRGPEFLFLAECYWDLETRLQQLGFDFTYDKRLYDRIVGREATEAFASLPSLAPEFLARSAHFIENHDERRIASLLSFEEHRAAALLTLTLPGLRLLHEGQLTGARVHANLHFARRAPETPDEPIAAFYEKLLGVLRRTAVGSGDWKLLAAQPAGAGNPTHASIALIQWQNASDALDLAAINLAPARGQCFAPIGAAELAMGHWRLTDWLGDEVHERSGAELAQRGLYLDLPRHGAQLFHWERIQ